MKPAVPMTHLVTVVGSFRAKVMAARLGAEGILAQMRGGIDGVYPIFEEVQIFVRADQLEMAREVLLADAVDAAFDELGPDVDLYGDLDEPLADQRPRATSRLIVITFAVVLMLVLVGYLATMYT
jgi:hypothetical protein